MRKKYIIGAICLALLLSGCTGDQKYQRISFDQGALGERIAADTEVINNVTAVFPEQLPIYEIKERNISQQEFDEVLKNLNLPDSAVQLEFDGNTFKYNRVYYTDFSRGYFDMTDEELEKKAWEVFNQIPFLEGEYQYMGIKGRMTLTDSEGEHITRAGVRFQKLLDGTRVAGNDTCMLYFDGSGFVEAHIVVYSYEKTGTMDVIPLKDAEERITSPDGFTLDAQSGAAKTLAVDRVNLILVNQHSSGCTILQPIYSFSGTAEMKDGTQSEFSSKIIAIPESYTYEADESKS